MGANANRLRFVRHGDGLFDTANIFSSLEEAKYYIESTEVGEGYNVRPSSYGEPIVLLYKNAADETKLLLGVGMVDGDINKPKQSKTFWIDTANIEKSIEELNERIDLLEGDGVKAMSSGDDKTYIPDGIDNEIEIETTGNYTFTLTIGEPSTLTYVINPEVDRKTVSFKFHDPDQIIEGSSMFVYGFKVGYSEEIEFPGVMATLSDDIYSEEISVSYDHVVISMIKGDIKYQTGDLAYKESYILEVKEDKLVEYNPTPVLEHDYYLVGSFNGEEWDNTPVEERGFAKVSEGEYKLTNYSLKADDKVKLMNKDGEKMEDDVQDQIEKYIDNLTEEPPFATGENIGCTVDYYSGRNRYIGYLTNVAMKSFENRKVALDCANGSSWMIARSVFDALGAKTFVINDEPNGVNVNEHCGSTHIEGLCDFVKEKGVEVGFAFDGDADRCLAVDENGNVVLADEMLTPDSSRFWPVAGYEAGKGQPSFDKQYVRDWLKANPHDDWTLPQDIVDKTIEKYLQAYELLTGKALF